MVHREKLTFRVAGTECVELSLQARRHRIEFHGHVMA